MKKIFALAAATIVLSTASFAQTGQSKSDTTTHHKTMKKTMKKPMKKRMDSTSSMSSSDSSGTSNRPMK